MSDILKPRILQQTATYWGSAGSSDLGRPAYDPPVEISCRWEDTNDEFVDKEGRQQVSKAMVYVDRDLDMHGVIRLGPLSEITDQSVPFNNDNAWEIRSFNKIPNRKATKFLRYIYL